MLAREPTLETQSPKSGKIATNSDPIPTNSDAVRTKSDDAETRDPILELDLKGIAHPPTPTYNISLIQPLVAQPLSANLDFAIQET